MECPKSRTKSVREVIEEDLKQPLESMFTDFEEVPLASASLAQVHRAKLKSTGEIVAIKVQHKWVKENYPGDAKLIDICVNIGEKVFPTFKYKVSCS